MLVRGACVILAPNMASSIAEFFTLRGVAAEIAQEPIERRAERAAVVTRARQKREAAEALWSVAQPVEALHLLIEALRLFRDVALEGTAQAESDLGPLRPRASVRPRAAGAEGALDTPAARPSGRPSARPSASPAAGPSARPRASVQAPDAEPTPETDVATPSALEARLKALGVSARQAQATAATIDKLDGVKVPELNRDARGPETDTFRALAEAAAVVDAALEARVLTRRDVTVRRLSRGAWVLVALAGLGVGAWFALRGGSDVLATATGVYGNDPMFGPERAVDGDNATEWLLPDNAEGVLELRLAHPRRVDRVRLVNGHNREFNDRATAAYELEVYAGARLLKKVSGRFATLVPTPQPVTVPIGVDGADRVRFLVKGHHRSGGALAEISVE